MKCEVITTKQGDIEYRSIGTGTPVLFMHGGHSNCQETLCHTGLHPERYRLITPSRPGYGQTPLHENKTPEQAAALIAELLNYLSVDSAIVYGISAGGLTALSLASQHPDRVNKLILASAVSKKWLDEHEGIYKAAQLIFRPGVEKVTWAMVRFFSRLFPALLAGSFFSQFSKKKTHKLRKEDINSLFSALKTYSSKSGFLNDIDQNINDEIIANIQCPTLIIHSENDNSVPLEHAQHAHKLMTNCQLEVLQNTWGHLLWLGADADIFIKKTKSFIDE